MGLGGTQGAKEEQKRYCESSESFFQSLPSPAAPYSALVQGAGLR